MNDIITYLKNNDIEKKVLVFLIISFILVTLYYLFFMSCDPNDHLINFIYNL